MPEAEPRRQSLVCDILGCLVALWVMFALFRVPPFVREVEVERPYLDHMTRERVFNIEVQLTALVELLHSFDAKASEDKARAQVLVDDLRMRLDRIPREELHNAEPREKLGGHHVADDHAR